MRRSGPRTARPTRSEISPIGRPFADGTRRSIGIFNDVPAEARRTRSAAAFRANSIKIRLTAGPAPGCRPDHVGPGRGNLSAPPALMERGGCRHGSRRPGQGSAARFSGAKSMPSDRMTLDDRYVREETVVRDNGSSGGVVALVVLVIVALGLLFWVGSSNHWFGGSSTTTIVEPATPAAPAVTPAPTPAPAPAVPAPSGSTTINNNVAPPASDSTSNPPAATDTTPAPAPAAPAPAATPAPAPAQ